MSTLTVKRGIEFQADLYGKADRTPWLEAVGKEIETKGVTLKVGESANVKQVKNAADLIAAYKELQAAAKSAGSSIPTYLNDLLQAIDDVVKPGAKFTAGDAFDFSADSALSKALGLNDGKRLNYASAASTEFGKAAIIKPEATMAVDGVTLQIVASLDLSKVPHMSTQTLRNAPVTYGRDGEEVEDTRVITGLTKEETVAVASRSLNDLQRPKSAAGLTVDQVPLDEMNWDSDSHALRRANPYVSFSLDGRSFETNPNNGQPRVAVGRDFFYDVFMAKKDLSTGKLTKDLQKADLMYRARIRYGSDSDPFDGTRVLIGMKEGTAIAPDGTKHARKVDSRTDMANQGIFDTLVSSAQTGKLDASWSMTNAVAPASAAMYRVALQKGITNDVGGETGVLALEPAAVARQIRGRFHLNETSSSGVLKAFQLSGQVRIAELSKLIEGAPDWASNGALPSKSHLQAQALALLDHSAVVAAATEGLKKVDPSLTVDKALIDRLWPGEPISTKADAKLQRAVADAIRVSYDGFAENVDQLQRLIGGNEDSAVRSAGSASDVRDFMRQKSAVARFMARAEASSSTGVSPGNPATYTAYAKRVLAMPDGKDKTEVLQDIGIGLNQLQQMNDASFTSPVRLSPDLVKKQTFDLFLSEFDAQLTGPQSQSFIAELAAFLSSEKKNDVLENATDKTKVMGDIRKNLVTAHVEILHRMVEGAGAWGQAIWFSNYRQAALHLNPQSWNFIIGSMDYTEFYDAPVGQGLSFKERVSRAPLDGARMSGAMISNDMQIELQAEEGYTGAIRTAQYALNGATAGLLMDYALEKKVSGLFVGDAAGFERWVAVSAGLPDQERKAFLDDVTAFARAKGSPIDIAGELNQLVEQESAIRVLVGFAKLKNPALDVTNRKAVQDWYRAQTRVSEAQLNDFLTEVARYAAAEGSDIPLSPNLLRTLDFTAFTEAYVGRPTGEHAALIDDLRSAEEVWAMVKKAQQDLSLARGQEVQRVLRDNDLRNKGWDPPTKPKGDYAIDYVLP